MSEAKPHPITLDGVVFTRSIVTAVLNHVPSPGLIVRPPDNTINVTRDPDSKRRYTVTMMVKVNPEADASEPYMVDMQCHAAFTVDESLSEEEALRGVNITGHSVVYGAIREAVAWLTNRQIHGGLMLGLSVLQSKQKTESAKEN